ncbi:MAG: hypothetical protein JG762_797 [Deferribacteraceae bacterium]|jgi:hypothetical protein|nr:hypothetical protein [Deferribacteraceae bacterium]
MSKFLKLIVLAGVLSSILMLLGCGSAPSSSVTDEINTNTTSNNDNNTILVSGISLVAPSNQLVFNESVTITFSLYNETGNLVSVSKDVIFTLDDPSLGSLSTGKVTTTSGTGTITFTSRSLEGNVTLTAEVDGVSQSYTITIANVNPPSSIELTANPSNIIVSGTSNIQAIIKTSDGSFVDDGTVVSFTIDKPNLGTITNTSVTKDGVAYATFLASNVPGSVSITAKAGSIEKTASLQIDAAETSSISFLSADPQILGLAGSGQETTSLISFEVKDENGARISVPAEVEVELFGPGGGEYLQNSTDNKVTVSTVNGVATVILNSGTVPGTVTLVATIVGTNISTSSGVISIGGGVPSESRFSLSAPRLNFEGLDYDGVEGDINVLLADRYGNTNLLANTTVKFFSECGGVEPAAILDATGAGKVTFRTQRPIPYYVLPDSTSTRTVIKGEYNFLTWFDNIFKTSFATSINPEDPNPRDGFCTVTAVVDGEESFNDLNGNGEYDSGEPFTDTYDDVYEDADDTYTFDSNTLWAYDLYNDGYIQYSEKLLSESPYSKDGVFSGFNNKWDGNKKISKSIRFVMSGTPTPYYILQSNSDPSKYVSTFSPGVFNLEKGEVATLKIFVGDRNLNAPISGTRFTLAYDLSGLADITGTFKEIQPVDWDDYYRFGEVSGFNYNIFTYSIKSIYDATDNTTSTCLGSLQPSILFTPTGFDSIAIADTITLTMPCN